MHSLLPHSLTYLLTHSPHTHTNAFYNRLNAHFGWSEIDKTLAKWNKLRFRIDSSLPRRMAYPLLRTTFSNHGDVVIVWILVCIIHELCSLCGVYENSNIFVVCLPTQFIFNGHLCPLKIKTFSQYLPQTLYRFTPMCLTAVLRHLRKDAIKWPGTVKDIRMSSYMYVGKEL